MQFDFLSLIYSSKGISFTLAKVYLLLLVEATPKCAVLMVVSTQYFSLFCSGWVDSPWHIQKYFIFQHKLLSDQLIITSLLCCSETIFMSYYNIILSNSILKCSFIIFDSLENSILKSYNCIIMVSPHQIKHRLLTLNIIITKLPSLKP